ncbi:hypothetical protein [Nocardia sp. NPDC046763]|uniref:hypothetical protein n=1 Tax=Nocardia sp. NPDC046763 TaxID=3155256 RepID=UPI0033DC8B3A
MTKSIRRSSRFTESTGKAMMMTNETYRSRTRRLFTTVVLAGVAMAVPAMAAVPAATALSAAPGLVQVDRPWGWAGKDAAPVPAPPPVPPHGCDTENCGESGGGDNSCTDPSQTGNGCGENSENGGTGGGPAVAEAHGIHYTTVTSQEIER